MFIIKSLQLLNHDGILSFVLPKNFLNCLYYDKTRKYIYDNFQIIHIIECNDDKYIETQQDTVILIVRKIITTNIYNSMFVFNVNKYTIFANQNNINHFIQLYTNSKSLDQLGFKVSVGNITWNQVKHLLTHDNTKTRLIYSSDISNNTIIIKKYTNPDKKNFINKNGITRPMIVINRGYGVGEYKFNYCLIDNHNQYLIENHLICIEPKNIIPHDILIDKYKQIISSFNDNRTLEFIKHYFGNNAINTTELNYILPIYNSLITF